MHLVTTVAKRVGQHRKRRGMSQEELAAKAEISRGYLARVETARHEPSLSMLEKIARALRVTVADLVKEYRK